MAIPENIISQGAGMRQSAGILPIINRRFSGANPERRENANGKNNGY